MKPVLLEVCVDSLAGVIAAEQGCADRIELCSTLDLGGLTPSMGLFREARAATALPLFVMIRPRAGDFCLEAHDHRTLCADLAAYVQEGADGLVTGSLTAEGLVDVERMRALVAAAGSTPITFHRAFDDCIDPQAALQQLIDCGVSRVLTSGGASTARLGADRIRDLVRQAGDELTVVAGGGVDAASLSELVSFTGVREVHTSASGVAPGTRGATTAISLAPTFDSSSGGLRCTDAGKVRACRNALEALGD